MGSRYYRGGFGCQAFLRCLKWHSLTTAHAFQPEAPVHSSEALLYTMDTLHTFWDKITHYKAKSVHSSGFMNSATMVWGVCFAALQIDLPLCAIQQLGDPFPCESPWPTGKAQSDVHDCRSSMVFHCHVWSIQNPKP